MIYFDGWSPSVPKEHALRGALGRVLADGVMNG